MQNTSKIALIVVIVIVAVVMMFVVGYSMMFMNAQEHRSYCENWFNNLEQQRVQLENQLFSDPTQYNAEISDYNKECYY